MSRFSAKDAIYLVVAGGIAYGLYRLYKGANALGDAAGKATENATLAYLNWKSPMQLTKGAQLSRDEMIAKGYMRKIYAPFKDCDLSSDPNACYRFEITSSGQAYINQQKSAQGQ